MYNTNSHKPIKNEMLFSIFGNQFPLNRVYKFSFFLFLMTLFLFPDLQRIAVAVLADSLWQVGAYVAATLAVYNIVSQTLSKDNKLIEKLKNIQSLAVLGSSFLGSLPGCGGAIVVMTHFVRGNLSFGCVVAVLTATMGDAAFLLLASKPQVGFLIVTMSLIVGMVSGWLVDKIHSAGFMVPLPSLNSIDEESFLKDEHVTPNVCADLQELLWRWLLIPSLIVALFGSFQIDVNELLNLPEGSIEWAGAIILLAFLGIWSLEPLSSQASTPQNQHQIDGGFGQSTNFVLCWVVASFLMFELTIHFTGFDIGVLFRQLGPLVPMLAIGIGFLPGCGPQILVTTFYLSGSIPLSGQIGNALSNDGDALFPAIALAPKAAILATLYSAFPAIIVAYSYMCLFE